MRDAKHLKATLGKYEDVSRINQSSQLAISKGLIKSKLQSSPPSLIDNIELRPTILFDGREYSLFKYAAGWYLYRGAQLAAGRGQYHWLTCYSKESDGKQYAAKPYRKSVNTLLRIDGFWQNVLAGNFTWTNDFNAEFDWELYRKPIYEIVDKNFFKRQPKRK